MKLIDIPASRLVACTFCFDRMDSNDRTVYQFITGWARNSNRGNSVTLGKRLHRYACAVCIDKLKQGIPIGQLSMFETEEFG